MHQHLRHLLQLRLCRCLETEGYVIYIVWILYIPTLSSSYIEDSRHTHKLETERTPTLFYTQWIYTQSLREKTATDSYDKGNFK